MRRDVTTVGESVRTGTSPNHSFFPEWGVEQKIYEE